MKLNEIVKLYLVKNGATVKFFAQYIRREYSVVLRWLRGESGYKMNDEDMQRIHSFLRGEAFRTVDEILKNELD